MTGSTGDSEQKTRQYRISVSRDRLKAMVTPGRGGNPVSDADLEELLAQKGVVFGLCRASLEEARNGKSGKSYLAARGTAPERGCDGEIQYIHSTGDNNSPHLLSDGRVDYFTRHNIVNVVQGQELARVIPPRPGREGMGVDGVAIDPQPGRPARMQLGKGVALSKDGSHLIALIDGEMVLSPSGRVSVSPVHRVDGDVDLSTGHVEFVGTVMVSGTIRDGLVVRAGEDVMVGQGVESASIKAGGDIVVNNGIRGRGQGSIEAGGTVRARFLENSTVDAGGDVVVSEAIMHSAVTASGEIRIQGGRGLLVGGSVRSGLGVVARVAGAHLGSKTVIEVGTTAQFRDDLGQLRKSRDEVKANLARIEEALGHDLISSPEKEEIKDKLVAARDQLTQGLCSMERDLEAMMGVAQRARKGRVEITDTIHAGVRIVIAGFQHVVGETMGAGRFGIQEGELTLLARGEGGHHEASGLAGLDPAGDPGSQDPQDKTGRPAG